MLLVCEAPDNTVCAPKKSNQLNPVADNFISVLYELHPYIEKASSRIAASLKVADKDDLAQEAKLRLLQTYARKSGKNLLYFKRVAVNAMRDVYSDEKSDSADSLEDFSDPNEIPAVSTKNTKVESAFLLKLAINSWIKSLPIRLQRIYDLLYVKNFTQREAANILRISQPRIASYNDQLKKRGRIELAHLEF